MNKKLIAVAVAGALGAPGMALAQASTVQIYGTLVMNYNYVDQGGGAVGAAPGTPASISKLKYDHLNSHDSNLGFKGEEALGGGLAAWFQCESTFDPTGGLGQWCGRNSAFGMKGNYGNVYAGNWDTPAKIVMGNFRPFSTAGAYGVTSLWNGTQSNITNTGTSFTRRQANLISYASPVMSGFQLYGAWSAANEAAAQTSATTASKPRLFSFGAVYNNGPLILGAGYETHRNYNPAAVATYQGGTDRGWSLGAAYTFMGTLKVMGIVTNNKYELATGVAGTGDLQGTNMGVYADWAFSGPHRVRAGFTRQGESKGSAGTLAAPIAVANMVANGASGQTGTHLYALQYAYAFSKRTEVNLGYARVVNSQFTTTALQSLGARPNAGANQDAWVLGVKHGF